MFSLLSLCSFQAGVSRWARPTSSTAGVSLCWCVPSPPWRPSPPSAPCPRARASTWRSAWQLWPRSGLVELLFECMHKQLISMHLQSGRQSAAYTLFQNVLHWCINICTYRSWRGQSREMMKWVLNPARCILDTKAPTIKWRVRQIFSSRHIYSLLYWFMPREILL